MFYSYDKLPASIFPLNPIKPFLDDKKARNGSGEN
jgi:hypothetical protein